MTIMTMYDGLSLYIYSNYDREKKKNKEGYIYIGKHRHTSSCNITSSCIPSEEYMLNRSELKSINNTEQGVIAAQYALLECV